MEVLQDTYKDTKVGRIPKDWEVNLFGNFVEIKSGFGFKKDDYSENGFRLLRIDNVTYGKIIWNNIAHIPFSFEEKHKDLVLSSGDILLALNRPITNNQLKIGRITKNDLPSILYQRVGKLSSSSQELRDDFLYYLSKYFIYFFVQKSSVGSDQPFINLTSLRKMKVPIPSLTEQQKIAAILSTVDEQISITDKIIEKSKELKKGLMQKLFSEGIGHTEFKDTKIGRIPKDWEIVRLGDYSKLLTGGTPNTKVEEYWDGDIPWMASGDISKKYIEDVEGRITELGLQNSAAKFVPVNSIFIALNGQGKTKGTVAISLKEVTCNQSLAAYVLNEKAFHPLFVFFFLTTRYWHLRALAGGDDRAGLNLGLLRSVKSPLPPLAEQQKIAAILSEAGAKIEKEQTQKAQLEQLKKGLMQQLLTGKKRVKV